MSRGDHHGMSQAQERNTLLPRPDRSVMQGSLQPPPVPPAGLAMDRPRQPHVSETCFLITPLCLLIKLVYFSMFYYTCVRSCLMHGSETWPMKVEHELKINCTEMSMIRWMCGVKLNERKKSEELRELLGLGPVSLMIKKRVG